MLKNKPELTFEEIGKTFKSFWQWLVRGSRSLPPKRILRFSKIATVFPFFKTDTKDRVLKLTYI